MVDARLRQVVQSNAAKQLDFGPPLRYPRPFEQRDPEPEGLASVTEIRSFFAR